ncbi:anthrone oxygenase family protein [uncultured Roseobacter sp.]|uniref:anthrone oxygenase family protein n=1 Tax=uncultured Roseobacter sp. TaxID=114847 RepID=UPI002623D57B|nr:anthrone oxygenase family protein [uncultured Roseobacter sp.]
MTDLKLAILMAAILGAGALFGFYFTMSVAIMPGLDLTEPYAAITANQDIGRATQQSLWFVALLGTPIALLACIALYWKDRPVRNWLVLGMAGWSAMMVVTVLFNVPLNQILDGLTITPDQADLADLWASYSVTGRNGTGFVC